MTTIRLTGWSPGMKKISLTKLIQSQAELSVSAAKHAVDQVLEGHAVSLQLPDHIDAQAMAAEMTELGAKCEIA